MTEVEERARRVLAAAERADVAHAYVLATEGPVPDLETAREVIRAMAGSHRILVRTLREVLEAGSA